MGRTFFWLFWPDICVTSQNSGPSEHFQKLNGTSNQGSLKVYAQNLIFRHHRKEQIRCNAHLVGNYFLIWILKVLKKANCCISCINWLGWIPTVPICSAGPGFSEKKREREKEKDHTFTRASTWWHGWLTALLHSSSNSSIKIFMSLSVRRLLTYVTYPSRDPTAALYKDHLKMDRTLHTIWFL